MLFDGNVIGAFRGRALRGSFRAHRNEQCKKERQGENGETPRAAWNAERAGESANHFEYSSNAHFCRGSNINAIVGGRNDDNIRTGNAHVITNARFVEQPTFEELRRIRFDRPKIGLRPSISRPTVSRLFGELRVRLRRLGRALTRSKLFAYLVRLREGRQTKTQVHL